MIVDTSAIVAVVLQEDDNRRYREMVAAARAVRVSAATLVEATMVLEGRAGDEGASGLESWITGIGVDVCPVTERTARIAQEGWRRFGKGRHKAGLNLGDCFAYALAIERDEPLLFKGDDFAQTDVKRAL